MPRTSPIKWRKIDEKELAKAVQKFNAKRTRLIKANPEMVDFLPAKLSTGEIRASVETRQDFNNRLASINRFMKQKDIKPILTPAGVKTTNYEVREIGIKIQAINTKRRNQLKRLNPTTEKGTMGKIRELNLSPKKLDVGSIRPERWRETMTKLERQAMARYYEKKNKIYKKNFKDAVERAFGGSDAEQISALVDEMETEQFIDAFYDNPELNISYVYSDPAEEKARVSTIKAILERKLGR